MNVDEATAFMQMCGQLNIFDSWQLAPVKIGPRWTRQETQNDVFTWPRLDRNYISLDHFTGDNLVLVHHISYQLSDHIPVTLLVKANTIQQSLHRSLYFKADSFFLQKPGVKQALQEVWEQHRPLQGDMNLEGFVRAWTALRSKTKQLQYADVHKLSALDQLKRSLENLTANQTDSSDVSEQSGKLSPQQSAFMDDVPTYREFTDILLSSPKGRAPGWDGFNTDAISEIWALLGQIIQR
ncbi:hypothetical protein R1sor_004655 [Riccia sorocarpa]|uniref:Endonuclease/exonuclease/phosphatase domain-containing protein n=1 Tax=Riccia sorocarpa TaxID=122646 RepID=A0ABD3HKT2_9MARC